MQTTTSQVHLVPLLKQNSFFIKKKKKKEEQNIIANILWRR